MESSSAPFQALGQYQRRFNSAVKNRERAMTGDRTLALLLVLWSTATWSQTTKIPIEVTHTGSDDVGRRFAYELRDQLKGSNSFRVVESASDPRLVVRIISIGRDETSAISLATTVDAETIPVNGLYVTSQVLRIGSLRTRETAGTVVTDIDESVTFLRNKWPSVYRLLVQAP